jgi:hypothetical protein
VLTLRGPSTDIPLSWTTFICKAPLTHEVTSADGLPCNFGGIEFLTRTCAHGTRFQQKEAVFAVDPMPDFVPFAGWSEPFRFILIAKLNDIDPQAWLAAYWPACRITQPSAFTNSCLGIGVSSERRSRCFSPIRHRPKTNLTRAVAGCLSPPRIRIKVKGQANTTVVKKGARTGSHEIADSFVQKSKVMPVVTALALSPATTLLLASRPQTP